MEGIYKINLIPNDLSVEETILQIADTLDNLNGIVDDVFTRITSRIKLNVDKTTKLQERIDVSRLKIEKLAGMQKAIKVFSSAKYPAAIVHEHYQSIFDTNEYQYEPKKVTLSGKSQRQSNDKAIQVIYMQCLFEMLAKTITRIFMCFYFYFRRNFISSMLK